MPDTAYGAVANDTKTHKKVFTRRVGSSQFGLEVQITGAPDYQVYSRRRLACAMGASSEAVVSKIRRVIHQAAVNRDDQIKGYKNKLSCKTKALCSRM